MCNGQWAHPVRHAIGQIYSFDIVCLFGKQNLCEEMINTLKIIHKLVSIPASNCKNE